MGRRRYKRYPPLSLEQQRLVEEHRWIAGRLAHSAKCLTGGHTGALTKEDLESVALFAICVAATRFNVSLGFKFSTYAWNTARGYIQHALRDISRMVRTPRDIDPYKKEVFQMLQEGKSYREISIALEIDESKVLICETSSQNYHVSYDSSPEDWVSPEFIYNDDEVKSSLLSQGLTERMKELSDAEMGILMKYIDDIPLSEEEREFAVEKFIELQNLAYGLVEDGPTPP
jgi:hypothetical protein